MKSAYWVDVPRAPQISGSQTSEARPHSSNLPAHVRDSAGEMSDQASLEVTEAAEPSGPLPASELPAVTHERHVIPSISFSEPPPRDHSAPGSAELMRPSVSLLKHQGLLNKPSRDTRVSAGATVAPEAHAGLTAAPEVTSQGGSTPGPTPQSSGSAPAWGQSPAPSLSAPSLSAPSLSAGDPHGGVNSSQSVDSGSGAPRDARSQLWVNQPSAQPQSAEADSQSAPARNPKLGESLARLTQRQPISRSTNEGRDEVTARDTSARDIISPASRIVVKPRGLEEDERYATLCERIWACQRCPRGGAPRVTGDGHYGARFMFVIGTPTDKELKIGRPLMAQPERELFHQILSALSLSRLDVYITNLFKCGSTLPTSSEWAECQSHFFEELELVQPELIVTLGYLPSVILLGDSPNPRLGVWGEYQGIPVMPTMHPSEILDGQVSTKRAAWRHLREFMRRAGLTPRS